MPPVLHRGVARGGLRGLKHPPFPYYACAHNLIIRKKQVMFIEVSMHVMTAAGRTYKMSLLKYFSKAPAVQEQCAGPSRYIPKTANSKIRQFHTRSEETVKMDLPLN